MQRLAKKLTVWGMSIIQRLAPGLALLSVEEQRKRFFLMLMLLILTPTMGFFIWHDFQTVGFSFDVILEVIGLGISLYIFATIGRAKEIRSIYRIGILYMIGVLINFITTGASPVSYVWFYFVPLITYFLLGHVEGSLWVLLSWLCSLIIIIFPVGFYRYDDEISLRFSISYTIVCILAYGMELSRHRYYQQLLNEKLALEAALQQVNTLQGLLPICASCKKIRDDGGYWHQVESYMRRHTGVEFSHSICPDCRDKLYPMYAKRTAKAPPTSSP